MNDDLKILDGIIPALANGARAIPNVDPEEKLPVFQLRRAADITMLRIEWAWDRRIPLGGVTLLPGREGLGKSTMFYEISARLTRGQLDGDLMGEPCDVVVIGCEDTVASVAKPRLAAAGADMDRVWFLETVDISSGAAFSVPYDVPALNALLDELENPKVIGVDPLDAHLSVDTHKKADTQRAIGTLTRVAQDRGLAVIGIAHHSKAATSDPLDRVNGSKAFTTSVRSVLTIAPHPHEDTERVIACSKANLTQRETIPVLKFRIEERRVTEHDVEVVTSGVVWLGEAEGVDADSVLARAGDEDDHQDACEVLTVILSDGPVWAKQAFDRMAEAGFSKDQTKRAKAKLRVRAVKIGRPGDAESGWKWEARREHQGSEGSDSRNPLPSHPSPLPSGFDPDDVF